MSKVYYGVQIWVDGVAIEDERDRPLGAVLHRAQGATLRQTPTSHAPRGLFCGMGICFDCLVTVDGRPNVRACMTPIRHGMTVETKRP